MKTPRKARPSDRITDNAAALGCIHPADYLRAVSIRRIRRYTLAERVLLLVIASLVAALIIYLFRA